MGHERLRSSRRLSPLPSPSSSPHHCAEAEAWHCRAAIYFPPKRPSDAATALQSCISADLPCDHRDRHAAIFVPPHVAGGGGGGGCYWSPPAGQPPRQLRLRWLCPRSKYVRFVSIALSWQKKVEGLSALAKSSQDMRLSVHRCLFLFFLCLCHMSTTTKQVLFDFSFARKSAPE